MELGRYSVVSEIVARLKTGEGAVKVAGTWGSFAPLLVAHLSQQLCRPIVYVCPHIDDADKLVDDLAVFGNSRVELLPAWEGEEDLADATNEIGAERLKLVSRISYLVSRLQDRNIIIPVSVQGLCQSIPDPGVLEKTALKLEVEKDLSPEDAAGWLVDNGFESVERIDLPGQFARRGGIIDIYAPVVSEMVSVGSDSTGQSGAALRVEFFGDCVESIRQIDLDTLRSSGKIENINIVSAVSGDLSGERELFLNILPKDTLIVLSEPETIQEVADVFVERSEDTDKLYNWSDIYKAMSRFARLHINRFTGADAGEYLNVDVKSVEQFQHKATSVLAGAKGTLEELLVKAKQGKKVLLYCEAAAEIKRVGEIIIGLNKSIPKNFKLLKGFINQGFRVDPLDTIVISHHELFGQYALRRRQRPMRPSVAVDTLSDLQRGDYVVHVTYGIGKFIGVKTIKQEQASGEYITIEFADKVKIHVSVNNITLVQKYIGTSPKRPKLSKIGSKKWEKQKEKVARSVRDLAGELLELQAQRQAMGGIAFGEDTNWQIEFEDSFPYQETTDQTTAAAQIKSDMKDAVVMDRLLCGDVGYGKTELAMRAAFKAVQGGKQVAMLVPTTVLSVQHGRSFAERFAEFPVCIEVLNRFKTTKQARDIVERAGSGRVDVLIGTHRILSKDVDFKDLGLLIIDEEQRFGVEHKERLKRMRVNVDILTMTATPIPRTLHMSLLGLRDISSLGTPPLDRRSVVTSVTTYNDQLIRKGIIRELNRQGQVFFLHNRVKTIERKAIEIAKLVSGTDARVAIAHGQMSKRELEKAMVAFVTGQIDVLVCTTIIESGLDIPNANTIFIDNADRFGLAELHQLRGRVGRYKHRAYAYMMLPKNRSITPIAGRRLKAIEEYSHLGAGFRIALRDLEIRGAGNILGSAQSGHIQLVGYQMYCQMLEQAVRKLKGQEIEKVPTTVIDLGFSSYIPKNYIPTDRHRMDVYRKMAVAANDDDLKQLADELADVYGPMPKEVELLLELSRVRIAADKADVKSIVISGQNLVFTFAKDTKTNVNSLLAYIKGKVTVAGPETVYLRLDKHYFEPATLMTVLRKIFSL
ncbi:transcription-repair coupling factor [Planctomycetota bacterium]